MGDATPRETSRPHAAGLARGWGGKPARRNSRTVCEPEPPGLIMLWPRRLSERRHEFDRILFKKNELQPARPDCTVSLNYRGITEFDIGVAVGMHRAAGNHTGIIDRACELGGSPRFTGKRVVPKERHWGRTAFDRSETAGGCHRPPGDGVISSGAGRREFVIGRRLPRVPGVQARAGIAHAASVSWLKKSFGVTAPAVFSRRSSSVPQSGRCLPLSSREMDGCERPSRSAACCIVNFSWARHSVRVMPLIYACHA